jgi:glycosyltransferase involved in cell wall biosynthesis
MSRYHPFIMLVQAAEDYAYRHADVVVSMLPKVREYMESRGMAPHKLNIIPNGIDADEWLCNSSSLYDSDLRVLEKIKADGNAIVGYAGSHGVANALNTLLDAAIRIKNERIAIILVGSGPEKKVLLERAQSEGLNNVIFIDPIKKELIPSLLQYFDVAYIGLQGQPLFRFGISPNKLMDYMMAGRPVLMAINAGNDPVREAGCGLTVPPEDPEAVANGIRTLLNLKEDERKTMGQRGREYILKNHTYPILAQRFLEIMV